MLELEYLLNSGGGFQADGKVGQVLMDCRLNPALMRPYINRKGVPCVSLRGKNGKAQEVAIANLQARGINSPVFNQASLTKDAWIEMDRKIMRAVRKPLRAWADLEARNPVSGFDAMSVMTYEYQTVDDGGEAIVDMDLLTDGRNDRPLTQIRSIPLPITHADFSFSERELRVSRRSGVPLDTTLAERGARAISEKLEKTTIGLEEGISYGTRTDGQFPHVGLSKIYGYTNFPYRITKTDLTTPTGSNPEAVMADVLEMIQTMQDNDFYGPYVLYHSTPYSRWFNDDYFRAGSTSAVRTLRERLLQIEGIESIRSLPYLTTGYRMIMLQMEPEYMQAINGMEVTPIQWDSMGGARHNFKLCCIKVPLLKAPSSGITPILDATTA